MNAPVRMLMTCDVPVPADAVAAAANRGRCFCGAVEIEVAGAPVDMGYCHCRSCRSYSGAPVTTFKLFHADQVKVVKGAEHIAGFARGEMSHRRHCRLCGGHLMTLHPEMGFTDVQAEILPGIPFRPTVHLNYVQTVFPIRDGLTKLRDFPAEAGGSGELMPE